MDAAGLSCDTPYTATVLTTTGAAMFRRTQLLPVLILALGLTSPAPAATLVRDGKPLAVVALPTDPDATEKLAAKELIDHIERMSGAKLDTVTVDPKMLDAFLERTAMDGKAAVVLGRAAMVKLEKSLGAKGTVPGTFVVKATKDHVFIAGSERGRTSACVNSSNNKGAVVHARRPRHRHPREEVHHRGRTRNGTDAIFREPVVPDAGQGLASASAAV